MWSHLCASHPPPSLHQHHGPRQESLIGAISWSSLCSHILAGSLLGNYLLFILATFLGVASLLQMPLALAHSPPRTGNYELTNNAVRTMLASGRQFARLPVSPYYASTYSRRYSPALTSKVRSAGSTSEHKPVRPLTDPYYYYDLHQEPSSTTSQSAPIPSCKELRLMWLTNQFGRYRAAHRDNHKNGWSWLNQMPEVKQLLQSFLQHLQGNPATGSKGQASVRLFDSPPVADQNDLKYGKLTTYSKGKEPPVYIAKIVPSADEHANENAIVEKPSSADELSFGIIHTSPDDGEDDQEELVDSNSIQGQRNGNDATSIKLAAIDQDVRVDRNGNHATFGKFIDGKKADREGPESLKTPSSRSNLVNERKSVKAESKEAKSGKALVSSPIGSSRMRFQSSRMPGVWHNKPVIPSVRII